MAQACFGVVYTYTLVAQSGQNGIASILGGPSVNSAGANTNCAFPAAVPGGQSVFVGNGSAAPVNITPNFISSTRNFGAFVQINDSDVVVAQDQYAGNESYYIRTWHADVPGNNMIVTKAATGFVQVPTINNSGQIAYLGFDGNTNYTLYTTNSAGGFYYQTKLGNNLYRPQIADNGIIVGKVGPGPTSSGSVRVYTPTSPLPMTLRWPGLGTHLPPLTHSRASARTDWSSRSTAPGLRVPVFISRLPTLGAPLPILTRSRSQISKTVSAVFNRFPGWLSRLSPLFTQSVAWLPHRSAMWLISGPKMASQDFM